MLHTELSTQVMRVRTLIAFACLAAIPIVAGLSTASDAGHRNGNQGGLFGAATYSSLNHAAASLQFIAPLLLPLVVALLAVSIASSDRDWGLLRYLYVQPVSRRRLLTCKLAATTIACIAASVCVLIAGVLIGLALFGWHPFHLIGAHSLSTTTAVFKLLEAAAYTTLCMLSIAAIALALGIALPRGAEALATSTAFVATASIVNGQASLHTINVILPVHYWQDWTHLFDHTSPDLGGGALVQLAWMGTATALGALVLMRRDPAA